MPDVYLRPIEPLIAIVLAKVCGSALRAIAALLGRFLPRLGPLVAMQAAFLFCVCRWRATDDQRQQGVRSRHYTSATIAHRRCVRDGPTRGEGKKGITPLFSARYAGAGSGRANGVCLCVESSR